MKTRWMVSEDGVNFDRRVRPINAPVFSYVKERDKGQAFFRLSIDDELRFHHRLDWAYFHGIERDRSKRCMPLYIRLEIFRRGWEVYWTGRFSTASGKFDLDRCDFEVKPETWDRYSCVLERIASRENLLNAERISFDSFILPDNIQIWITIWPSSSPAIGLPAEYGWQSVATRSIPGETISCPGQTITFPTTTYTIYWRQYARTPVIGGVSHPPPGDGWFPIRTPDIGPLGPGGLAQGGRWARVPTASWPLSGATVSVGPISDMPPGTAVGDWSYCQLPEGACNNWLCIGDRRSTVCSQGQGIFICTDGAATEFNDRGVQLSDALSFVANLMECDVPGIRSDFFEINSPGDAPGYAPGVNYVTGRANEVSGIVIVQKSDAIDPEATNPATLLDASLRDLLDTLFAMFRVQFDIDADGFIRIEHVSYWQSQEGIDTTEAGKPIELLRYDYQSDEVPPAERAVFMEAGGVDFIGRDVMYFGPCVTGTEIKEVSAGQVTTDLGFILSSPASIDKRGMVMVATAASTSGRSVINSAGALTGAIRTNAPLGWSNLQRDYWQDDRYLPVGRMNGVDTTFSDFRPNVEQQEVAVTLCEDVLDFDPNDHAVTRLSAALGVDAEVWTAKFRSDIGRIYLTLRYAY